MTAIERTAYPRFKARLPKTNWSIFITRLNLNFPQT